MDKGGEVNAQVDESARECHNNKVTNITVEVERGAQIHDDTRCDPYSIGLEGCT